MTMPRASPPPTLVGESPPLLDIRIYPPPLPPPPPVYFNSPFGSVVKEPVWNPSGMHETQETVRSLGWENALEQEMANHSSTLAWEIPQGGAWRATVHAVTKSQT